MKKEYLEKSQIKFTFEVSKEHYTEVENSYKNENKEQDLKEVTLNKLFQENLNLTKIDTDIENMQERIYEEYEMTYNDCLPFKNQDENFDIKETMVTCT